MMYVRKLLFRKVYKFAQQSACPVGLHPPNTCQLEYRYIGTSPEGNRGGPLEVVATDASS